MRRFGIIVVSLVVLVSCTLLNSPPEEPTPVNPVDGATNVSLDVALEWEATDPDGDELSYDVFFGTDPSPTLAASGLKDRSYDPGRLDYATTYYWKVLAYDGRGGIAEGPVWSFKTLGYELVQDDFEEYDAGEDPSVIEWGEYENSGSSYAVISGEGNPGKSLKFVDPSADGYAKIEKNFPEFRKGVLEFDVRMDDQLGWFDVRLTGRTPQSIFGPIIGIGRFAGEMSIVVLHEGVSNFYQKIMEAQIGEWYRIKVVFDLQESGEYDVYVDGEYKGYGVTKQTEITDLLIWTLPGYRCSECYIDNVKLIVLDEGYSAE